MGRITAHTRVTRITIGGPVQRREDLLTVEEPLEIRVGGVPMSVTMRTPGSEFDLAVGFLVSEGIVASADDIAAIRHCAGPGVDAANTYNVLDVTLAPGVPLPDPSLARNFYTTSSCGVCGKASIDAVRTLSRYPVAADDVVVAAEALAEFPNRLREGQAVFEKTGGLHAAGLFDGRTGRLLAIREDVGRHNAVDKVIGWAATQGLLPLAGCVLMVSGRASFELTQKASMAGIPVLAAVSAPSSLAVELAIDHGLTVVGFIRGTTMVVYSRSDRIVADDTDRVAHGTDRLGATSARPAEEGARTA